MKILFACQFFNYYSGSAMYVHNLASEMKKRGHDVTILSELGGDIVNSAVKNGVRVIDFSQVFDIQDEQFDIMHLNQFHPAEFALEYFPDTPAVFTIHSELATVEQPYNHPSIKEYISHRDTIRDKYKNLDPILLPLPIDMTRFNKDGVEKAEKVKKESGQTKKIVLYVGTIDFLRENVLKDLAQKAMIEDFDLWCVGRNFLPYPQPEHVKMLPETFFVEKWYEMADEIAGILYSLVWLEASAMGKPYRHYEVDEKGKILEQDTLIPLEDMSQYALPAVAAQLETIYKKFV